MAGSDFQDFWVQPKETTCYNFEFCFETEIIRIWKVSVLETPTSRVEVHLGLSQWCTLSSNYLQSRGLPATCPKTQLTKMKQRSANFLIQNPKQFYSPAGWCPPVLSSFMKSIKSSYIYHKPYHSISNEATFFRQLNAKKESSQFFQGITSPSRGGPRPYRPPSAGA